MVNGDVVSVVLVVKVFGVLMFVVIKWIDLEMMVLVLFV